MPNYDYECGSCNHQQEHEHGMMDKIKNCPKCNSEDYYNIIRPTTICFKGSGFYINDYKVEN